MQRLARACLVLGILISTPSPSAIAAGPFDASALEPLGAPPAEGEVYAYRLRLRNDGETASASVEVTVPSAALFVGADGLEGHAFDETGRVLRWQGDVDPGTSRTVTLHFVAGRAAGGQMSSLRATVRPWTGSPTYLSHSAEVDTRPAPAALTVGRVGVTAAGLVVLGWLLVGALAWLILRLRRRHTASWAPIAILLPLAFLSYFAWLAREDARIAALPETRCTVLDRALDARTSSSASSPGSRTQTVYQPRLALGYVADGEPRVAQGFGTDSRLSGARAASVDSLLARYAVGATVPCAVDPRDPRRAYVERGYGGAYLFALIPLPVLGLGVWGVASDRRRRD